MMNSSAHTVPTACRKALRTRLYAGRPLVSRARWAAIKTVYVLTCIAGVVVVLTLTDGIVFAIGLTVMAFLVGGFFELLALKYADYRKEWELSNGEDAPQAEL